MLKESPVFQLENQTGLCSQYAERRVVLPAAQRLCMIGITILIAQ